MQIAKNTVTSFHYRLRDEAGEELENSYDGDAVAYLHGHGNIIKGLEAALEGKAEGDVLTVTVAPKDAYGERVEDAVQRVPIKHLMGDKKSKAKIKPGMIVSVNTEEGAKQVLVLKAGKFNVDVDTNHPLAGKTLTFDVEVTSVREASDDEVSHGHAHGPGGHQH